MLRYSSLITCKGSATSRSARSGHPGRGDAAGHPPARAARPPSPGGPKSPGREKLADSPVAMVGELNMSMNFLALSPLTPETM